MRILDVIFKKYDYAGHFDEMHEFQIQMNFICVRCVPSLFNKMMKSFESKCYETRYVYD